MAGRARMMTITRMVPVHALVPWSLLLLAVAEAYQLAYTGGRNGEPSA
jgi:hypothetical protein